MKYLYQVKDVQSGDVVLEKGDLDEVAAVTGIQRCRVATCAKIGTICKRKYVISVVDYMDESGWKTEWECEWNYVRRQLLGKRWRG